MNVAVILAGGSGKRMGAPVPKQFLKIYGKPVIAYTLEVFEKHPDIDAIEVVSVKDYIEDVWEIGRAYGISKLRFVTEGGDTCQASTRNGIFALDGFCHEDDILMVHMSVSPLVDGPVISSALETCQKYGNAFSADPCIFNMCKKCDGVSTDEMVLKEDLVALNMPWTATFGELKRAYETAYERNICTDEASYMTNLFIALGKRLYYSKGSQKNRTKLTTKDDYDLLTGYLMLEKARAEGTADEINEDFEAKL
ncbi:MAG: 2-C-methyl-D-erythritol 4-phosphate cytidylyltransferase [Lachnospiraceae bacterium]|nr:2-C-methyl-D-erythritol 4-phosphate cytidylyltransferase [Lachnospiraceae bacterium]